MKLSILLLVLLLACEPPTKEWYEGGTLHKCTNAEWKKASKENKIATCADFIFKFATTDGVTAEDFNRLMPSEKFKVFATQMSEELDKSVATGASADTIKGEVATYAAVYWILLKEKVKQ